MSRLNKDKVYRHDSKYNSKIKHDYLLDTVTTMKNVILTVERIDNDDFQYEWYNTKLDMYNNLVFNRYEVLYRIKYILSTIKSLKSNIEISRIYEQCKEFGIYTLKTKLYNIEDKIEPNPLEIYSEFTLYDLDKHGLKSHFQLKDTNLENEYNSIHLHEHFITTYHTNKSKIFCEDGKHKIYFSNIFISLVVEQNNNYQDYFLDLNQEKDDKYLFITKFQNSIQTYAKLEYWSMIIKDYNNPTTKLDAVTKIMAKSISEFYSQTQIEDRYLQNIVKSFTKETGSKFVIMLVPKNSNQVPKLKTYIEFNINTDKERIVQLWKPFNIDLINK